MAKIHRRGAPPSESKYLFECKKCDSLVEFNREDVQSDQRDGDYVVCPVCLAFIAWSVIRTTGVLVVDK